MSEFYLPMAERALAMSPRSQESDASSLARHLRRLGKIEVNIRDDIVRGRGSPLRELGRIGDALKELQLRGIVKPADRQRVGSGRPAQVIKVNTALFPR